ncbi:MULTISPECIES: hypothetical protein [Halomonadaceae]|uniref:hypothetical protein n=1 Tax=Halomonadaceae TaxID=28256 RepID=UPI000C33450A|nr:MULTISPECIES: hypothetical protein [unclassified Halomonas]MBL1270240.1 hypothetical protein [Halomonas sp.]PKG54502.1 hypothetical protein CXF87_02825 [Halomonas sp. MES3-P3E]
MSALTHEDRLFLRELQKCIAASCASYFDKTFGTNVLPATGASITIEGEVKMDMYDHAPGLAFYETDSSRSVVVPPYTEYYKLRELAESGFAACYQVWREAEDVYEGLFRPLNMRICNSDGVVIDLYERGGWLEDTIPPGQWTETAARIEELNREGSFQSGWDNFSTAKRMHRQASRLQQLLTLSRHRANSAA